MEKEIGIRLTEYNSILKDVSEIYLESLKEGTNDWNKTILTSNFKIGKRILEFKQGNTERAKYGDKVLVELSKDLNKKYGRGFSKTNLSNMRKFYLFYNKTRFYSELSWSHYVLLLKIEDKTQRMEFEKEAIKKKLTSFDLQQLIHNKISKSKQKTNTKIPSEFLKKPILKLHSYRLIKQTKEIDSETFISIDLGFSIYFELKEKLSKFKIGSIIQSHKENNFFTFQLNSNLKDIYTYKAYLERVIDGDTILVQIDLGFSIMTKQRLRLRGIDTAELNTKQGLSAKKFIEQELKDCKYMIIKTYSKDKYDRHLVDVIYLKNTSEEEKVIKEGLFLNNELLSERLAIRA